MWKSEGSRNPRGKTSGRPLEADWHLDNSISAAVLTPSHTPAILKSCYNRVSTLSSGRSLGRVLVTIAGTRGLALVDALEGVQVYQHVDQSIVIGDGCATAQPGTLNTQGDSLAVDALGGGTLLVDFLVGDTVAVELVADAGADAGRQRRGAAPFGPVLVVDGADAIGDFREPQGAEVAATLVLEAGGATGEGMSEGHRQPGLAQGQALSVE